MPLTTAGSGPALPGGRGPRFRASYDGVCTHCGHEYDEGDLIGYPRGQQGICHAECADELERET